MTDPFAWLEAATGEQRQGFEIGLVYCDMSKGGRGPWIVHDGCRHLYENAAAKFNLRLEIQDYEELGALPSPLVVITAQSIGLRLV